MFGWQSSCWDGRPIVGALTSSSGTLKTTLLVGLKDFLLGWKSSSWDGRLLVGALTSSSEPLKTHPLLDGQISCLVGSFLVGMEDSSLGL